jgi:hypothetical protein
VLIRTIDFTITKQVCDTLCRVHAAAALYMYVKSRTEQ